MYRVEDIVEISSIRIFAVGVGIAKEPHEVLILIDLFPNLADTKLLVLRYRDHLDLSHFDEGLLVGKKILDEVLGEL